MSDSAWPSKLRINAYTGETAASSPTDENGKKWAVRSGPREERKFLKPEALPDLANWRDSRVGWGLILPFKDGLSAADAAAAKDAPESLQSLVQERGIGGKPAPVFRYIAGESHRGFLHRDGADIPISRARRGVEACAIPWYLLIYGSPEQIPWDLQYLLNARCAVGRLWLEGGELDNYIGALRINWKDAAAKANRAVVWAVDHGGDDITVLMRQAIAAPLAKKILNDEHLGPDSQYIDGSTPGQATATNLVNALSIKAPALVITTSHGQTGPLDDPAAMAANLGLPVDDNRQLLQPAALLDKWQPDGAMWYAHACCSAGSAPQTFFDGLVPKGSPVDLVLKGITKVGARIAPLPQALLGAAKPLRAFVGHVEPTFDWSLQQRFTGQFLTDAIQQAFFENLYQPHPIGLALRDHYGALGSVYAEYDNELRAFNQQEANNEAAMLAHLLIARDLQSLVMLGDPTAVLPPL